MQIEPFRPENFDAVDENLYLWTDSSCNWEFYLKHGFELVHEEKSDLYSTPEEDFKFMVFRKCLDDLSKLMRKQL